MVSVFVATFHAPAFALNTKTTFNTTTKTTILVGTQDSVDDLVYAITWNGKDKIEYLTQTNVTHKMPSWLALHPIDKAKLLVIYEDGAKHQNFKIGTDGKLIAEFKAMESGPGPPSGFGTFSKDGKYMVFVDYPNGGYRVARYLADGSSYLIPQKETLDDPNRYLGPNPSHLSHPHQFVEHPKLDAGYIPKPHIILPFQGRQDVLPRLAQSRRRAASYGHQQGGQIRMGPDADLVHNSAGQD
jgi:Lactonase, 7-bladed beta-propeller